MLSLYRLSISIYLIMYSWYRVFYEAISAVMG